MAYSTCLLIFSIVIIMGLIANKQTKLAQDVHPALAFVLIWVMIIWLSFVEGGQASLVGLAPINGALFKDTHPIAYKATSVCHKGDGLDRYLMGRQFCVLFTVFVINLSGAPVKDASLWGFPDMLDKVFLGSGLAMILFTCMVGQLNTQVNASHCMLDYLNQYLNLLTFWITMGIEFSGIMHASYLIQIIVGKLAGQPIQSNEEPKTGMVAAFFWGRVIMSVVLLCFSCAVTLAALFQGNTTMWDGIPEAASIVLFFLLLSVVGMLEGMQIAFFAVAKLRKEDRGNAKCAQMTCDLLYKGKGMNLPGFMIGRQLCVVSCFFVIARVTTIKMKDGEPDIFGVSDWVQNLFNTGLLGAVITTILGSISWQLVASAFPIAFLSNPFTYILLRICLFLEWTGICSGAWVIAKIHRKIAGFQRDEVYIGTAEERAAKNMGDHEEELHVGAGHMIKLPGFAEEAPASLQELMRSNPEVAKYIESLHSQNGGAADHETAAGSDDLDLEMQEAEA
jgi:silicon transporter